MNGLVRQLTDSAAAFRAVFANPNLRRLQLAWVGSTVGQWAYAVAVSVYAYRAGGAGAVGILWLIRMGPAALISPFAAVLADRYRRETVMLVSDLVRAALIGAAAAVAYAGWQPWVVYGLACVVAIVGTPFKPAESALVPMLASTPSELTAANVVGSSIESLGFFAGPAIAGILLGITTPPTVFVVTGVMLLWSAYFVARIRPAEETLPAEREAAGVLAEVKAGFKVVGGDARLRILVGLLAAQTLVAGAFEVLIVVTAIKLLGLGNSGVGFVNSAFGVGALAGALGAVVLVGVRRMSLPFVAGSILWGAPLLLIGAFVNTGFAFIMFGLIGIGSTLGDVSGFTLVQRAVPNEILGRVFGVMQMIWLGTVGIGAAITPGLIDWLGTRGTLLAVGAFVPVLVLAFGPTLIRIDAAAPVPGAEQLALLRAINIFSPLPGITLEQLASRLIPLVEQPGTQVIRQGDPGDRFYIIQTGEVDVSADGQHVALLGPGDYFGEIALLKDVPRTATCTAQTELALFALERDDFLAAVTGHSSSSSTAEGVVGSRLADLTATLGSFRGGL